MENVHREDLTDAEKGDAVIDLKETTGKPYTELAEFELCIPEQTVWHWVQKSHKISPNLRQVASTGELADFVISYLLKYDHSVQDQFATFIVDWNQKNEQNKSSGDFLDPHRNSGTTLSPRLLQLSDSFLHFRPKGLQMFQVQQAELVPAEAKHKVLQLLQFQIFVHDVTPRSEALTGSFSLAFRLFLYVLSQGCLNDLRQLQAFPGGVNLDVAPKSVSKRYGGLDGFLHFFNYILGHLNLHRKTERQKPIITLSVRNHWLSLYGLVAFSSKHAEEEIKQTYEKLYGWKDAGNPNFSSGEKLTSDSYTQPKLAQELGVSEGKLNQDLQLAFRCKGLCVAKLNATNWV